MRLFTLLLMLVLGLAQKELWFGKNGLVEYRQVSENLLRQEADNQKLEERNKLLKEEVADLKSGLEAIEELARNDLGFVKQGETFYRVLPRDKASQNRQSSLPSGD